MSEVQPKMPVPPEGLHWHIGVSGYDSYGNDDREYLSLRRNVRGVLLGRPKVETVRSIRLRYDGVAKNRYDTYRAYVVYEAKYLLDDYTAALAKEQEKKDLYKEINGEY